MVASNFGRLAENNSAVMPGNVEKFSLFTALIKVYFTGLKNIAYKNLLTLLGFSFFLNCSLGYFHFLPLAQLLFSTDIGKHHNFGPARSKRGNLARARASGAGSPVG